MSSVSPERILFEDDHLLAVNKLSGELVVKGAGRVQKLPLLDFLKKRYPGLRALHRLDYETSGVVVFAKTKAAYVACMETKFAGWKKTYRALVAGRIERPEGVIRKPLPSRMGKGDVAAITTFRVLERFANSSSVEADMATGRFHQIRRHFMAIGHPLALDDEYGDPRFNRVFTKEFGYRRFFLHAFAVELPHPITHRTVRIEAPIPRVFEEVLQKLRVD